jgi:hypothetical protein
MQPSAANGLRYPLVGGTRQRRFDGTNSKPRKLPKNAQTPISRVHAVLACVFRRTQSDRVFAISLPFLTSIIFAFTSKFFKIKLAVLDSELAKYRPSLSTEEIPK